MWHDKLIYLPQSLGHTPPQSIPSSSWFCTPSSQVSQIQYDYFRMHVNKSRVNTSTIICMNTSTIICMNTVNTYVREPKSKSLSNFKYRIMKRFSKQIKLFRRHYLAENFSRAHLNFGYYVNLCAKNSIIIDRKQIWKNFMLPENMHFYIPSFMKNIISK